MTAPLQVWHLTPDAPREPRRVSTGQRVRVGIGSWPIAAGQSVWLKWRANSSPVEAAQATWQRNSGVNSYWSVTIGPFSQGTAIEYTIHASDGAREIVGSTHALRVGPKIHLALLWHQHQPFYRVPSGGAERPVLKQPWVRLHALRDYYSMPALVAEHPDVHVSFNLTPVLLAQIDDYVERGATDRQLELTLKAPGRLTAGEREELLSDFFDADWHHQIFIHPRYRELFDTRVRRGRFSTQDVRDLQMWFNLAWFGSEFRHGPVELVTGQMVDVHRFVERGEGFSAADVRAMVEEQFKILRAVVPIHRLLQERGQIEVTTTPLSHPILPLLIDTDQATVDLPGATLPRRFSHPEDAREHILRAVADYDLRFGRAPRGMWPAEGAVSQSAAAMFAGHGIDWIASDRGVLARSGQWGYDADSPDVLCQPYAARKDGKDIAIFFRDTVLSDAIGFCYQHVRDPEVAVSQFVDEIQERLVRSFEHDDDRVVSIILDGENAWGGYVDDGRPFLRALYKRLAQSSAVTTVTFSEYLHNVRAQSVEGPASMPEVHDLFTGSWIDEVRSLPGVDLGTWIGEPAENRAWELLGDARDAAGAASEAERKRALEPIYAAEGSDWFWWFGDDQDSGNDDVFDGLFRDHLRGAYREMSVAPPHELDVPLVPRRQVWTFAKPISRLATGDWLIVRTNCPGTLVWQFDDQPERSEPMEAVGGVLAGARRFQRSLGKIEPTVETITFRFHCATDSCEQHDVCCRADAQTVGVQTTGGAARHARRRSRR